MLCLWSCWRIFPLFGLLWVALVVPVLPHQTTYSTSIPSTSTVERRIFRKCFIVRIGLRFQAWALKLRSCLPRGWRFVRRSTHDIDPHQWSLWALHQVLSMPRCNFGAWTAFRSTAFSILLWQTTDRLYSGCFRPLWDWCNGMQNISTELFPEIAEINKQCIPGWSSSTFIPLIRIN